MTALTVRPLTAEDLARRDAEPVGAAPPPLKRIRFTHHKLARLLASGVNQTEAGLIAGFSPSRVSILLRDPSFKALVSHYKENVEGLFDDFVTKLRDLSIDAVDEIRERIENEPELIDIQDLIKIATFGADRSGHGPTHRQEHDLSPEASAKIDALKQAVLERQRGQVIEARPSTRSTNGPTTFDEGETGGERPALVLAPTEVSTGTLSPSDADETEGEGGDS